VVDDTAQRSRVVCITARALLWFFASYGPLQALEPAAGFSPEATSDEPSALAPVPAPLTPRVFVRGQNVRFHYLSEETSLVFHGEWDASRVPARDFKVKVASFKPLRSPPPIPAANTGWREATVVGAQHWRALAHAVIEELAPAAPGQGVYLQSVLGDAVLFRDLDGTVGRVAFEETPAHVTIQHRYSWKDAVATVAARLEHHLRLQHPEGSLFLLQPPGDRLTLLDLDRRRCVLLDHPLHHQTETLALTLPYAAQGVGSLLVEGHGCAVLKNPVSSVLRLGNLGVQTVLNLVGPRLRQPRAAVPPLDPAPGMDLDTWETWLDRHTGTRREPGELRLLVNGEQFFPRFEQALREARRSIHLIVGIFDRDDVAVRIADLLIDRSHEIEVRVVLDQLSTLAAGASSPRTPMPKGFSPPPSILAYLKDQGSVQVRSFLNPWLSAEHSKLLIVDGERAWIGGMNFGREYRYEWHDLMVEVEGPIVTSLERAFRRSWDHAGNLGDLAYAARALAHVTSAEYPSLAAGEVPIRRLPTRTTWKPLAQAITKSLDQARNHVYLQNPYLFDNRVVTRLARARHRGVDVRVVLPSRIDIVGGERSNLVTANYLLQHGVRVFFYPGMTHVKAVLVDDWACLGSANFNHLSLRLNQELNLATSDPGFVQELRQQLFERDFERSTELTEPLSLGWVDHLFELVLDVL
jgi:cardiolipin synthase A/B